MRRLPRAVTASVTGRRGRPLRLATFSTRDSDGSDTGDPPARFHGLRALIDYPTPLGYTLTMHTVAETPTFSRQADKIFSADEKRDLITFLAQNPLAGDEIPGTGGVRKMRYAVAGRGKLGGARVIHYDLDETWKQNK